MHRRLLWGLTAAVVAAACSDAVTPKVPVPSFSFQPNGITLNKVNGSLNEPGTQLAKGFDFAGNPHHGDAVVATFYWLGPSNIVDSVIDFIADANNTRAGNIYHLVDSVSRSGYSMATYVATNVQNFPDSSKVSGQILAVRAYLHQPVADGGIEISAWSGVENDFTLALGDHHSASGADTGANIVAHTAPLAVNAGALAFTVTMGAADTTKSPNAFTGLYLPSGFTAVAVAGDNGRGSDTLIINQAGYAVQASSGTVDPQWTWQYEPTARPWLVTTFALNAATSGTTPPPPPPPPPPPTGDLAVTTSSSGSSIPATYTVTVDGSLNQSVASTGSVTFASLAATTHTVVLTVPANCTVTGGASQSATVTGGATTTVSYAVSCVTPPGNLTVSTTTTGANIPASYTVTVDGSQSQTVGSAGSVTFANLAAGSHTAVLTVASNCTVSGGATRMVTVPSGGTATLSYAVNCNAPPVVSAGSNETAVTGLMYSLHWSFTDANHNGPWTYTINWGDGSTSSGTVSSEGSVTTGHTYVIVTPRSFTVTVTVRDAAGASASSSKTVSVLLL